jgi:hypothetical protein
MAKAPRIEAGDRAGEPLKQMSKQLPPKPKTKSALTPRQIEARTSLWKGPDVDGITSSLIGKFLECKERFRLKVCEGLREARDFDALTEFGSIWHAAEENYVGNKPWLEGMDKYVKQLKEDYCTAEEEIDHWFNVAKAAFPIYIAFYKSGIQRGRTPLLEEVAFNVPYTLPSGRTVRLRGKFDCVFWMPGTSLLILQENKTKGEKYIDTAAIPETLPKNGQTMIYQTALRKSLITDPKVIKAMGLKGPSLINLGPKGDQTMLLPKSSKTPKVGGVVYNVIRRPLSDQYAIRQKKTESKPEFYKRLHDTIKADCVNSQGQFNGVNKHFFRWDCQLQQSHVDDFHGKCLNPLLEHLCDWWEWIEFDPYDPWRPRTFNGSLGPITHNTIHYQTPWGYFNTLAAGFRGAFYELLTVNRRFNLEKVSTLFPELDTP